MCCFKCCLWCLEKFIKFLNRNAYIMVSTEGEPYNPTRSKPQVTLTFLLPSDRHLWEEFLCLSQKCLHAAHEERYQVRLSCTPTGPTPQTLPTQVWLHRQKAPCLV
jgi:hypothetical protein